MELILCTSCKRLWPEGTTWCGNCRRTLGKRICPDGHVSPVYVNCCSTCGSAKLTPGTGSLNLRPISWLVSIALVVLLLPTALGLIGIGLRTAYVWFMNVVFERLLILALFSWVAGWILGERSRKTIGDLWLALFRLVVNIIQAFGRLVLRIAGKR